MSAGRPSLRADLHVHSYHSGYASHLSFLKTRDCYSDPDAVYRVAKARGMDLVTITDHDSVDGCLEFLDRHPDAPDFFISEEIECWMPDVPLKIHIGAYGIDERIHREVQRLRGNVFDVAEYLRQQDVCFSLNHLFFFYRRQMAVDEYVNAMLRTFSAFEVRNGAMLREQNELIEALISGDGPKAARFGGSDAHTLRRIGTTYTEAEGRTRDEYLASLRAGRTRVGGRHGTASDIAIEIYGVVGCYWQALAGLRRHDMRWPTRLIGWGWSLLSLPAEFVPILVAVLQKRGEMQRVTQCRRELIGEAPASAVAAQEAKES
jgi:predicted metal-dependent phosphoesterase TrpH